MKTIKYLFSILATFALIFAASAQAAPLLFKLTATDVVIAPPAPLFSSSSISGVLGLSDTVLPGASFGASAVTSLFLNFGGVTGNLADVQADIFPGPVQIFGTRSLDGKSLSFLDFRFGFAPTTPGCSFVCAGQILINSPTHDTSNFIAIDDFGGSTLSVISGFSPSFVLTGGAVPEPATWLLMIIGFSSIGAVLRNPRSKIRDRGRAVALG